MSGGVNVCHPGLGTCLCRPPDPSPSHTQVIFTHTHKLILLTRGFHIGDSPACSNVYSTPPPSQHRQHGHNLGHVRSRGKRSHPVCAFISSGERTKQRSAFSFRIPPPQQQPSLLYAVYRVPCFPRCGTFCGFLCLKGPQHSAHTLSSYPRARRL